MRASSSCDDVGMQQVGMLLAPLEGEHPLSTFATPASDRGRMQAERIVVQQGSAPASSFAGALLRAAHHTCSAMRNVFLQHETPRTTVQAQRHLVDVLRASWSTARKPLQLEASSTPWCGSVANHFSLKPAPLLGAEVSKVDANCVCGAR